MREGESDVLARVEEYLVPVPLNPPVVVRGLGLFIGVEVVRDRASKEPDGAFAKKVRDGMRERGVLMSITGNYNCVLRMTPPLTITRDHVDQFMGRLRETIKAV
jgi:4-aminobutyrate aminotransferase-like enzyme